MNGTPMIKKLAVHRTIGASFPSLRYRLRLWLMPMPAAPQRAIALPDDDFKQMSFTFAVIALSARVACADGALTRHKYIAFRESFPLKGHLCSRIRSLFALACDNRAPVDYYISQISALFPNRPELYISLVERLTAIAAADGGVSRHAERVLAMVAQGLEVGHADYRAISTRFSRHASAAHKVLGVDGRIEEGALKKRYRDLMRRYHPDRFPVKDLSPEVALLLQLKSSEINDAYRSLRRKAA
jgi:DnaJ like chaperone protein